MSEKYLWIAWERQRRSVELAYALNAELIILDYSGVFRYFRCIWKTFEAVKKKKPEILFVQNPSMVLAFFSTFVLKYIFCIPVVVDRHSNFLLTPVKRHWLKEYFFNFLSYATIRQADLTIITNSNLSHVVQVLGGNPFVLPDKIPTLSQKVKKKSDSASKILVITSFSGDEPIEEIWHAFSRDEMLSFNVYMSGNSKKVNKCRDKIPSNIILTGFLPEDDFTELLFDVDAVMVLTKMDYTLLCGCYEAIAAEKPLITTASVVLQQYFTGAVFVDNDSMAIARGVQEIFSKLNYYQSKSICMKKELTEKWQTRFGELKSTLKDIVLGKNI